MTKLITVKEYGYLKSSSAKQSLVGEKISPLAFAELADLIAETPDNDDVEHGSIFWQRGQRLQVRHYVGMVQTSDGTQIEILPKISDSFTSEILRNIVFKMLREVGRIPYKSAQTANLHTADLPLLEIFIRDFLDNVQQLVKRGIRSDYVRQTDNLPFLKGKLLIGHQLKHNLIRSDRFYVEYDSFEPDRPENRLIKSTLQKVMRLSIDYNNQRLARELLFAFGDIPFSTDYRKDFQACSKDRGMHYYQDSLIWCKLILNDEAPIPQAGERSFRSLLFPMPRLFEDYVTSVFKRRLTGWKVDSQVRSQNLLSSHGTNKQLFQMRPDLLLENEVVKIIADTKWKLLNQSDESNKFSISQADLYQVFAYAKYYGSERVILIYPKTETFNNAISFDYIDQNCRLDLWPMDLENENNALNDFQAFL